MVRNMSKNKFIVCIFLLASVLMILIPTVYHVLALREEHRYLVAAKVILESAEDCFYDQACVGNSVTLQELKNKGYYKNEVVNPKTRMYFPLDLKILYDSYQARFDDATFSY